MGPGSFTDFDDVYSCVLLSWCRELQTTCSHHRHVFQLSSPPHINLHVIRFSRIHGKQQTNKKKTWSLTSDCIPIQTGTWKGQVKSQYRIKSEDDPFPRARLHTSRGKWTAWKARYRKRGWDVLCVSRMSCARREKANWKKMST